MEKVRGPLPLQPPSVSCTEGFVSPPFRINPPWDLLRGKDVFESTPELEDDVFNADLTHWGPTVQPTVGQGKSPSITLKTRLGPSEAFCTPREFLVKWQE